MAGMEWVAIMTLGLVVVLALPVAGGVLSGVPALGLQAVAAVGALALCVVYVALGGPDWAGWGAAGLAFVGLIADTVGVGGLTSEDRGVTARLQGREEVEASLLGVQIPLFIIAALAAVAMGLDVATVAG
jgi:hypothetical protein